MSIIRNISKNQKKNQNVGDQRFRQLEITDIRQAEQITTISTSKADKSATVSTVTYDNTNGKLTKTINGTKTTVVVLDTTPTSASMKPITSGGVYTALSSKVGSADVTTIVKLTQAEYDALTEVDTATLYIIVG